MRRTKVWITPPSLVRIFFFKRSLEVGRIFFFFFWISNNIYSKRINKYTGSRLAEGYAGDLKLQWAIKSNRFEKENFPAATIHSSYHPCKNDLKKWRKNWLVRILKSIVQGHWVCCSYQFWVFFTSYAIVFFMYLFLARNLHLYICFDLILAAYLIIWQTVLLPCQKYFVLSGFFDLHFWYIGSCSYPRLLERSTTGYFCLQCSLSCWIS